MGNSALENKTDRGGQRTEVGESGFVCEETSSLCTGWNAVYCAKLACSLLGSELMSFWVPSILLNLFCNGLVSTCR